MATIRVQLVDFQARALPLVCIKTGRPADRWVPVRAGRPLWWSWLLLPFAVVAFQAAYWLARGEQWGWVPMSGRAATLLWRVRLVGVTAVTSAPVLLGFAAATGWVLLARSGLGVLLVAMIAGMLESVLSVGAVLEPAMGCVVLRRVHPRFRTAVIDQRSSTGGLTDRG
jgi:hypothetical protein